MSKEQSINAYEYISKAFPNVFIAENNEMHGEITDLYISMEHIHVREY